MRPRRIVRALHLWLGLVLGGLLVLAGLTGSALVFYGDIDAGLHPELASRQRANEASFDRAITTLRQTWPEKQGAWRLEVTEQPGPIPARYYNPPETARRGHAPMLVWLSPDGTQVLRREFWGQEPMTWIYDLHYQLQLGKAGGRIFGFAGILLLLLLLSGLWAWWPRGRWDKALRFKRQAGPTRRLHDLHKLAGLAGLPLLLMLTVTGVMLALPDETRVALDPFLGNDAAMSGMDHHPSREPAGLETLPSSAVAIAREALPMARPAWIEVPGSDGGTFKIRMRQPADPSHRFPHSYVWIGHSDGVVHGVTDAATARGTGLIMNWLHPLHDGSAGGMPLRILVLASGLVPLLLFTTGVMRWRRGRLARGRQVTSRRT